MSTVKRLALREAGFSLPEVLVVVVIIGVLAAIAIPRFSGQEDRAAAAVARSDARQIALNIETSMLPEVLTDGANIVFNNATNRLAIIADEGQGEVISIPAKLSPGTILPPQANGNGDNRIKSNGDYCIAAQNRDQIVYYSNLGFVSSCVDGAEIVGGGGGGNDGSTVGPTLPSVSPKTFFPAQVTSPAVAWEAIAFGNGRFVAVGDNVQYGTTATGTTWDLTRALPNSAKATDIVYGAGKFLAVTNSAFYSSPEPHLGNGNWATAAAALPASGAWRVAYGGGRFVAISPSGTDGTAMTSTDGTDWTNGPVGAQVTRIAFAGGKFLALRGGVTGNTTAYISIDGTTWTLVTLPDPGGGAWTNISAAGNKFYLTGNNTESANLAVSANGETWSKPTLGVVSVWAFAVGGGGVVYLVPSNFTAAVISLNGGTDWLLNATISSAPWTAGTSNSLGVITVVGSDGSVMSSA
jgi:prepilin-type N-terminal cleavage/methylation domain-containing protein